MNSITKIGFMALTKIFNKKPYSHEDKTYTSEVIFSKEKFSLDYVPNPKGHWSGKSYKIWSIELGIIDIPLKDDENIYHATLRVLKKLQKEDIPSHLIISGGLNKGDKIIMAHVVYRLSEEQELTLYYQGLLPSIEKRYKRMGDKAQKEHAQWLEWCKENEC